MKARKHILVAILMASLFALAFAAGACDRTDLEGTVSPSPVEAYVGEAVVITLEVPSELEDIHREMWVVEPESLGTVECVSSGDKCRRVTFTATSPGTGTIEVWGFYKQTNPQFITEAEVTVTE